MEAATNLTQNGSPESPHTVPLLLSPDEGQSPDTAAALTTVDDNSAEPSVPEVEPVGIPDSPSPVEEESHSYGNNMASFSEPRAMQVKLTNASAQPAAEEPADRYAAQQGTSAAAFSGDSGLPDPQNEQMAEAKIVARLSPDDEVMSPVSSPHHRRNVSMDQIVAKVPTTYHTRTQSAAPKNFKAPSNIDLSRGQIDTAVPFESVKAAVSKFGGIVDWKAHRVQTVERRKVIGQELEKAHEEILSYKKQCEAAEVAKIQVLKELDSTKRLIEELKHKLEQAQKEEEQAKREAELAKPRAEEMEQGIADEASFSARAQLEIARARHTAAVTELKTAKGELEQLKEDYASLLAEKDEALRKTEEAASASKEAEASVQELTDKLFALKQSLDSAHAAHMEAEEPRTEVVLTKEWENLIWEKESKQAEDELRKLNELILSTKDIRAKLGEATTLLQTTKAQLEAYTEPKPEETGKEANLEDILKQPNKSTHGNIEIALNAAKKELAEVEQKIEKVTDEVNTLKVEATSLKLELDKERMELAAIQQREGMASNAFLCLEAELIRIKPEIACVHKQEKEERKKMADLPKRLHEAAHEADRAKALAQTAYNDLQKAKEQAEHAKEEASAMEGRLHAAQQEIEAARAAEKLALTTLNMLAESESAHRECNEDLPNEIALPLEEYYELCKRVHEAEVQANIRVAAALSQVEAAKEAESRNLNMLEEVTHENSSQKEALESALEKANKAEEGKLAVDQELRTWRAKHGQKQKAAKPVPSPTATSLEGKESNNIFISPGSSCLRLRSNPRAYTRSNTETELTLEPKLVTKKKKRSFFPRLFMFLVRKKAPACKTA